MTFTPSQLIKIGRLFCDGAHPIDTFDIARVMRCDEGEVYSVLTEAREAYRASEAAPKPDRKESAAAANRRWAERNKAVNAELRREARV